MKPVYVDALRAPTRRTFHPRIVRGMLGAVFISAFLLMGMR